MSKSISITIHPAPSSGEYLTVHDAMHQVLDFIEALEKSETADGKERQIVWRLKKAHTNSPPLTVTAEAFPIDPAVSIDLEADRVINLASKGFRSLLKGRAADWLARDVAEPLRRVLKRNMNGIGRTHIEFDGNEPIEIVPQSARIGITALDKFELERKAAEPDWTRIEFGAVEVEVRGLRRWNNKPALTVVERLSGQELTCVVGDELAKRIGPTRKWAEAWNGRRLLVAGEFSYNADNRLTHINAESIEDIEWKDVALRDLKKIDILGSRTVREHIDAIRKENGA